MFLKTGNSDPCLCPTCFVYLFKTSYFRAVCSDPFGNPSLDKWTIQQKNNFSNRTSSTVY